MSTKANTKRVEIVLRRNKIIDESWIVHIPRCLTEQEAIIMFSQEPLRIHDYQSTLMSSEVIDTSGTTFWYMVDDE